MQIRDLEYKTNLDRATIRFYEKQGFVKPIRQENGYRVYSNEDCDTLLKIKLMRQLGMSLEKIRELQQGSEDFAFALKEQITKLEQQIQSMHRARDVCLQIMEDGAGYRNLNAGYYLDMLSRPAQNVTAKPEFREMIPRDYHPARRMAARYIDFYLADIVIRFLLIVVLRVRPFGEFLSLALNFGVLFLMVPLNAWMLSAFGTTPGKCAMGLGVDAANGGKLSWRTALEREWNVLRYGLGFGIPIWEIWRLYRSFKEYGNQTNMDWDYECEYRYHPSERKNKAIFVVLLCCIVGLTAANVNDVMKPRYRGDELTVAKFADNYNYYLTVFNEQARPSDRLQSDGTRYHASGYDTVIYINGQPQNENQSFEYIIENGAIRKITYQNSWTDVFYFNPVAGECTIAAFTVLMSQDGTDLKDLEEFEKQWYKSMVQSEGSVSYGNVEVNWKIDSENCEMMQQYYFTVDDSAQSKINMEFEIIIKEV